MKILVGFSQNRVIMGGVKKRMEVDKFYFFEFQQMSAAILLLWGLFLDHIFWGLKAMALLA